MKVRKVKKTALAMMLILAMAMNCVTAMAATERASTRCPNCGSASDMTGSGMPELLIDETISCTHGHPGALDTYKEYVTHVHFQCGCGYDWPEDVVNIVITCNYGK